MTFPVRAHLFFNFLAYAVAAQIYFKFRRPGLLTASQSLKIVGGALLGAALGSVLLEWFLDPMIWRNSAGGLGFFPPLGKTLVGGLLGGLIGVESVKKFIGHHRSTGDDFVWPILIGIFIGRIGCFLAGLSDNTYGNASSLPWAWDFGDGIPRHPTQVYEMVFVLVLGACVLARKGRPYREGDLFKLTLAGYLAFRFFVDFLKPYPGTFLGLNAIQVACLGGLAYYAQDFPRLFRWNTKSPDHADPSLHISRINQ